MTVFITWSNLICSIISKMGRAVAMSRKCAPFLPPPLLNQIIHTLVLCHLDNCLVIWASALNGLLSWLQIAQNRAARLVLGCSSGYNVADVHVSLNWLNVEKRPSANLLYFNKKLFVVKIPNLFFIKLFSDQQCICTPLEGPVVGR